jgi:large subunit ribosomal protein L20
MKAAKGFRGARSKVYTVAKNAVDRANAFAYVGRKLKKREYRTLWIARINASCRANDTTYSRFIHQLNTKGFNLNRKTLADLAMNNPDAFKAILNQVMA